MSEVQEDNFIIYQGANVDRVYTCTQEGAPYVLSGKILRCQFRRYPESTEVVLDATVALVEAGDFNQVRLTITPQETSRLDGVLEYDILASDPGGTIAKRLVEGVTPVSPAVTR